MSHVKGEWLITTPARAFGLAGKRAEKKSLVGSMGITRSSGAPRNSFENLASAPDKESAPLLNDPETTTASSRLASHFLYEFEAIVPLLETGIGKLGVYRIASPGDSGPKSILDLNGKNAQALASHLNGCK